MSLREDFILFGQKVSDAVHTPSASTQQARLGSAVWSDHVKIIKRLLASRVSPDAEVTLTGVDPLGVHSITDRAIFEGTAVEASAKFRRVASLSTLLDGGAKPDLTTSRDGTTPLMYAVKNDDLHSMFQLLQAGADITKKNNGGMTAPDIAHAGEFPEFGDWLQGSKRTVPSNSPKPGSEINQGLGV